MQVWKHLETVIIFFAKQHEFRQKHSTETAFGQSVGNLVEIFDKRHKALALFVDLRKVFDSVEQYIFYLN